MEKKIVKFLRSIENKMSRVIWAFYFVAVTFGSIFITQNVTLLNSVIPLGSNDKVNATPFRVGRSGFGKRVQIGNNNLVYFDHISNVVPIRNITSYVRGKTKLLSILVSIDLQKGLPVHVKQILLQANRSVDIFVVNSDMELNQTLDIHRKAFSDYRFSLILEEGQSYLSSALVTAIMMHTVPIFNGFFEVSSMFANGVAAWNEVKVNFAGIVNRTRELNRKIKFLWSYQQILQEVLVYRYNFSPTVRARYMADKLPSALRKPLAFAGIYSKLSNIKLRDAIRESWKTSFDKKGIEVKFFLSIGGLAEPEDITVYETENDQYNDLVLLPVMEGYRHNSRKGVAFARWIRDNRSNSQYIIKTDDDVYLRADPLLIQLHFRIPLGYVWGFMDYISPVPKNTSDPFYSPPQMYPFSTFPTYPRGAVRVLSTDLMEAIANKADRKELRMIYGDDPSMGVHLRQLIMDKDVAFVNIDDFASYKNFAMQPSCTSQWSSVKNETWVIHHVNATQISCLWASEQAGAFPACNCL